MAQIGDRLKNICAGQFLGWTHEGKIQLITLPHGCALLLPRGVEYAVQSGRVFLSLEA